jgi:PPOX class probable F420-dependent enzyme
VTEQQRPMGHGVKQRDVIKMTPEEVDAFLNRRLPMSVATFNHDGTIHLVAMWYGFLDGAVAFETKAKAQKVKNLRRDPRLTCLVEDGDYYEELMGVELVGTAEIVEDRDRMWPMGVSLVKRYMDVPDEHVDAAVEMALHNRVVVKMNVERVVTWDHRKLGLPSTRPQ